MPISVRLLSLAFLALVLLAPPPSAGLAGDPAPPACPALRAALRIEDVAPAAPADHPPLADACTGAIRPGAPLGSGFCTMNFVFTDADGSLYVGTAGHCVGTGQRVSTSGVGAFGTVVYRRASGVSDFGLIRVDADKLSLVSPTLCQWGGPIAGADPGSSLPRDAFYEYGWGFMTDESPVTRARALVEVTTTPSYVEWAGMGSGGDSGAPLVNEAGYAVGIHTYGQSGTWGVHREGGPSFATILAIGRTAVPTLALVPGDPSSIENAGHEVAY